MIRHLLIALALSATFGCSAKLPGDYSVSHGDRGKAWLEHPDETLAHGGVIKELYENNQHILLVAYPEMLDGKAGRMPIDKTCYVALLIDAPRHRMRQVNMAEAARLATRMSSVEAHERPCLKGMSNAPG